MNALIKQLTLAAAVLLAIPAFARAENPGNPTGKPGSKFAQQHPRRNQVNKRVRNQRARINQGVRSGEISKGQAHQLRANDNAIKSQEHADVKANGGSLTKPEQKQINQEENANSALVHDEKHPAGQ
jgi:hypothetical protein